MNDPNPLYTIARFLDVNGKILILDDEADFGFFSYSDREKGNPKIGYGTGNHPSPAHHWQAGLLLRGIAHALGMFAVAQEMNKDDTEPTKIFKRIVDGAVK